MRKYFNVIEAVSPSIFGGETKNQDRILWDPQNNTATVCDGTTSSPFAEKAASAISRYASSILNNDVKKILGAACDLLVAQRNTAIKNGVKISGNMPQSVRAFVEEAAKENLKKSFQTTLICTAFERQRRNILTKMLSCGDSGFFAFSPDGQLLLSNLSHIDEKLANNHGNHSRQIHFGPGTELLAKIVGPLSRFPILTEHTGIAKMDNWVLCSALCLCDNSEPVPDVLPKTEFVLQQNELLIVPRYLLSVPKDPIYKAFRLLYYSRYIRRLSSPVKELPDVNFDAQGNTTAVLPDHFYTGQWEYIEERFDIDTNFLLCSDGFYHAFSNTKEMQEWLMSNELNLTNHQTKKLLLNRLHHKLNKKSGDDDISFIWIRPKRKRSQSNAFRTN